MIAVQMLGLVSEGDHVQLMSGLRREHWRGMNGA